MLQIWKSVSDEFKQYLYPPEGKVFLITGASRGIGKALAYELAKHGKSLILTARSEKLLNEVKEDLIKKYNISVYVIVFDVTNYKQYENLFKKAHEKAGPVDTIILNAGIAGFHSVGSKHAFSEDLKVLQTNLLSPMACINEFCPYAKSNHIGHPHIVVISSIAADLVTKGIGAYSGSKSGISKYLESCALELESSGFYFTNIQPGFVTTDIIEGAVPDVFLNLAVSPQYCAQKSVDSILKRRSQTYVPHWLYYPLGIQC
eukprot:NODE_677_length_5302_cov_0.446089.p3 type:complete len:260 gc:universal NODE_677_length_5302_cov_0.446089:1266-487(-)